MFVSVVLPTRNRASVVGDAVRSVLGQTHADLELVVVDGGDDATREVVGSFADDRLRYVREDGPGDVGPAGASTTDESAAGANAADANAVSANESTAGVSAARNTGVRRTDDDAEAIAFVDSDDRWHPEKLERQIDALRTADDGAAGDEYGVVYTGIRKREGEPRTREGASGDVREAIRHLDAPTYTSTLLVRRTAFEPIGGFDERLACFEDWDLCLRLAREWKFAHLDAPLVLKGTGGNVSGDASSADNASADPDRLAGALPRLFGKHDLPAEARAQLLADAGRTYCEDGRLATGRPYLRRALALDLRPKAALALALALTGSPRAFDAGMTGAYAAERRLAGDSGEQPFDLSTSRRTLDGGQQ